MKELKNFLQRIKIIGTIFLIIAVIILMWAINGEPLEAEAAESAYWCVIISAGAGLLLLIYARRRTKNLWNELSSAERAEILASELKSGKRDWCINQFGYEDSYYFAPLKKNQLNEFGHCRHIETDRKQLDLLIKEGKIKNMEMTALILESLDGAR